MLAGTTCKEVKMSSKHFLNIAGFAAAALALAFAVLTLQAAGVQSSTSNLYSFADLSQLDGQSVLVRNDNGVNVTVQAQDLTPGEAITLWWVFFNFPEHCTAPVPGLAQCSEADLFNEAVQASVMYATGHVIGGSGHGNYGSYRSVGDTSGDVFGGPGLLNPLGAEIHMVLRTHGPTIPGLVNEQINTFNGGCQPPEWWDGPTPPHWGAPGPNECVDLQFAVHLP
jgi:hypothetical protein